METKFKHSPLSKIEFSIGAVCLILLVVLPLVQTIVRNVFVGQFGEGGAILKHLLLPITFIGATLASKSLEHLKITLPTKNPVGRYAKIQEAVRVFFSALIVSWLIFATVNALLVFPEASKTAVGIPLIVFIVFILLGFALILKRVFPSDLRIGSKPVLVTLLGLGLVGGLILSIGDITQIFQTLNPEGFVDKLSGDPVLPAISSMWIGFIASIKLPLILILIVAAFFGTPLFVIIGGISALMVSGEGFYGPKGAADLIQNSYQIISQDNMSTIALFTLMGFLLTYSKAGERFVSLFKALFGSLQGGVVIVTVIVSAFFTTITGASGITILALGMLLNTIIVSGNSARERFSMGFITASGSLGLLFPPSLAILLYGSTSLIPIPNLFLGGVLPGILLVGSMIVAGLFLTRKHKIETTKTSFKEFFQILVASLPEVLVFFIILIPYFLGLLTMEEISALAVVYVFVVEVIIRKEISFEKLKELTLKTLIIIGGIFIIFAMAKGFSQYFADNNLTTDFAAWLSSTISSPIVFLLLLNVCLLVVGIFMDLYSAIIIIVPLIIPIGVQFGIHPVHLAMIFLCNLEVGRILPPIGLNLFLASYRFNRPLVNLYRDVLPFIVVQIVVVLLVTYVPFLSTAFLPPDATTVIPKQ